MNPFTNVGMDSVVHVDAPVRLTSAAIVERLRPALARLGMRADLLEEVAGIRERRIWDGPTSVAQADATAMVLSRNGTHRYLSGVTRAATEFSHLCRGTMERMVTDTRILLEEGLKLAARTFEAAGWDPADFDEFAIHQVSAVHTTALMALLGLDPAKVLTIFGEHGNVGPASVPMVLSKLDEMGRLRPGHRIGLMGIGSGLNCTMAEVVW